MSELAMRPVDIGPFVEDGQDLGLFPVEQPEDRVPARHGVVKARPAWRRVSHRQARCRSNPNTEHTLTALQPPATAVS